MNQPLTSPKRPLWWWIATWFGSGLSPIMSGTAGSLAALPFAFVIQYWLGDGVLFAAAVAIFIIGCWASSCYIRDSGNDNDPGEIVVDEVAGQWLLLAFLFPTWQSYLAGFVLFRLFDIVKPWPISLADRKIHGGFGVMFDDILAALFPVAIYFAIFAESHYLGCYNILRPVINILAAGHYVL